MSFHTVKDIPLHVISPNASAERRITPSWSVAQLKTKLEPITGIPPSCQKLTLKLPGQIEVAIECADEDVTQIGRWSLQPYAELHVADLRPPSALTNLTDTSSVQKYTMPASHYESLPSTVLSWKRAQKLGRFDPSLPAQEFAKAHTLWTEVSSRDIHVSARCRLGGEDMRRGEVAFVGEVEELPGKGPWVGVRLDEPIGKNDGSLNGKRYFDAGPRRGAFVRPERVEIGEWGVLMDEDGLIGEDREDEMEEL